MSTAEITDGLTARPYQLRLLDHAIKHNSIIYLPTGSGKTYIAIMILRHFTKDLNKPISEGGKRSLFLCNTVELARQNAKEISRSTNFQVGFFIGDMNVDNWPSERWESEINKNQVFVGTSQVFVDMVSHNFLSIKDLCCVIIDECHHATKAHPMHQFLSLYMQVSDKSQLPRTVGLTGVLLKSNKQIDILTPLQDLEAAFRGKIITIENMDEFHNVMIYSTSPNEVMLTYDTSTLVFPAEVKIKNIITKCFDEIEEWDIGEKKKFSKNLVSRTDPSKLKQIKSLLNDFIHQLNDMGIYAASVAIMGLVVQLEINKRNIDNAILRNMYRYLLTQCDRIRHILVKEMKSLIDHDEDEMLEADIILNYSTPKLQGLLSYFLKEFSTKEAKDISCLVFVQRRYTAKCLYYVIKNFVTSHHNLSRIIIPEFTVGKNASMTFNIDSLLDTKWNRQVVGRFRQKECNLIVCSSVLEEGIDVQSCNYVISFDEIYSFSSYIQMKGRARSRDSTYVVLCNKMEKCQVATKIQTYQAVDVKLKKYLISRTIDREIPDESRTKDEFKHKIPPFVTPSGAILQAEGALMLLHRYCQSLPRDSFTNSAAIWQIISNEPLNFQVSLTLPPQSTIKDIIYSDSMDICKWAMISAAFKACIKLYENDELSENLLPITKKKVLENVSEIYFSKWKNEPSDNSTNSVRNNHRIYDKMYPDELNGALPIPGEIAYAYCINIEPKFQQQDYNAHIINLLQTKSTYAIVLKHKLPALAPMPLFMTQGPLVAEISSTPFEFVIADERELKKLKVFNKMLFCDIRKFWNEFLAIDNRNGQNSFLIAPVQHNCSIDWEIVNNFQHLTPIRATTEAERIRKVHNPDDYLGNIVNTWYSADENTRYVVTKIRNDLTPLSPFANNAFRSFAEYVENNYKERVMNDKQFLIEVKPLTSRTNFFVNSAEKSTESKRMMKDIKIILIPEMCHNFRFPGDLWLKALLLPSILHRLHYLLHAEKLRIDINRYLGIPTPANYKPAAIEIDYSLRRVGTNKTVDLSSMLPALDTTRQEDVTTKKYTLVDVEQGNWKAFVEPIDIYRNMNSIYPIEVDYYYQFVNNLLEDMEKLNIDDITAKQVSVRHLEAHKPTILHHVDDLSKQIANKSFDSARTIKILGLHAPTMVHKTAEQFEFLAAITTAASMDVYDMERFEVLGDSFLKFSSSFLLMRRHPKWNEGLLTTVKSKMVSNKNLLLCLRTKFSATFINSSRFEPNSEWLPPMASVPTNLLAIIANGNIRPNVLYELKLTDDEINSGVCSEQSLEAIDNKGKLSDASTDCLNEYLYKQTIADKVLADCVEALLGVCVKNYGVQKSFEMLGYFGIFDDPNRLILPRLLEIDVGNPLIRSNVKPSEVDEYLLNHEYLEVNLGYKFKNRAYLLQALTHPSDTQNNLTGCYQQLEFLGDAILDFLISCYIFEHCTHMNPGEITTLRSALVNNITLACVCVRNRFHQFMLYKSPTLADSIKKFVEFQNTQDHRVTEQVKILLEESSTSEGYNMAQNIDVPKALGDTMEAIFGAVFLDSGNDLSQTWNVIRHLMDIELNDFIREVPIEPVRQLYEYRGANPTFQISSIEEDVVLMNCSFYCRDVIKTVIGCGGNKSMAKKAAAKMALQILLTN